MNVKKTIMIILTVMTFLLTGVMSFFQYLEMIKNQDDNADKIMMAISRDIKKGEVSDDTLASLKKNFFYTVWHKNKQGKWVPIVYDSKMFKFTSISPDDIPKNMHFARRFPETGSRYINNDEFVMWINGLNYDYYFQYIGITFLSILLVYLILTLLTNIIFVQPKKEVEEYEFEEDNDAEYAKPEPLNEYDFEVQKFEPEVSGGQEKLLIDYKELWMKHFKISDGFKANFPFAKIIELAKFGTVPGVYLDNALKIAGSYFNWYSPKFFLNQNSKFIDPHTGDILDNNNVKIPLKGDAKGDIFIPLFPYDSSSVFGYLNFDWNDQDDFYIADLLYFLKLVFSDEARFIFTEGVKNEKILSSLKMKLEKKDGEVFAAILSVDNKNKFQNFLTPAQISKIDKDFFGRILMDFKKDTAFYIRPFYYGVIGDRTDRDRQIKLFEDWVGNEDKHNYPVDREFGNVAATFSCGISFGSGRNIGPAVLTGEAEMFQKIASEQGGNQVVYS